MNVFIAGATGVLGRRVVRRLVEKGHHVVGLARSAANEGELTALRAEPRRGDLFNPRDVERATAGCDAVLHLATAIPTRFPSRPADWNTNDRLRTEGTKNLVNAALANRCRLFVANSVTYVYGDNGGAWIDETTPYEMELGGILQSAVTMENLLNDAFTKQQLPLITLRFGSFYGSDAAHSRMLFNQVEHGRFPIIGDGDTWWNLIQLDDAARAVVATVDNYERNLGEAFNIVDGAPVRMREFITGIAELLHARKPWHVPLWIAKLRMRAALLQPLLLSFRCGHDKATERLGWQPRSPDFRYGHQAALKEWRGALAAAS
jgi:nucleoside-diphosphate-sugar epimerase